MIIDVILDRKDGDKYTNAMAQAFVVYGLSNQYPNVVSAFLFNDDKAIKHALCEYIDSDSTYNPEIKNYINSQSWKLPAQEKITHWQFAQLIYDHFRDQNEILEASIARAKKQTKNIIKK